MAMLLYTDWADRGWGVVNVGGVWRAWNQVLANRSDSIVTIDDPIGLESTVVRQRIYTDDTNVTLNPRAQLMMDAIPGLAEGKTVYIGTGILLGSTVPVLSGNPVDGYGSTSGPWLSLGSVYGPPFSGTGPGVGCALYSGATDTGHMYYNSRNGDDPSTSPVIPAFSQYYENGRVVDIQVGGTAPQWIVEVMAVNLSQDGTVGYVEKYRLNNATKTWSIQPMFKSQGTIGLQPYTTRAYKKTIDNSDNNSIASGGNGVPQLQWKITNYANKGLVSAAGGMIDVYFMNTCIADSLVDAQNFMATYHLPGGSGGGGGGTATKGCFNGVNSYTLYYTQGYNVEAPSTFTYLKQKVPNTSKFRLPTGSNPWTTGVDQPLQTGYTNSVKKSIANAWQAGIGTVVDIHDFNTNQYFFPQKFGVSVTAQQVATYLGRVAAALKGTPGYIGIDFFNEPFGLSQTNINAYYQATSLGFQAVRAADPDAIVFVESPYNNSSTQAYGSNAGGPWVKNAAGKTATWAADKIVYSAHSYPISTTPSGTTATSSFPVTSEWDRWSSLTQPYIDWLNKYPEQVGMLGETGFASELQTNSTDLADQVSRVLAQYDRLVANGRMWGFFMWQLQSAYNDFWDLGDYKAAGQNATGAPDNFWVNAGHNDFNNADNSPGVNRIHQNITGVFGARPEVDISNPGSGGGGGGGGATLRDAATLDTATSGWLGLMPTRTNATDANGVGSESISTAQPTSVMSTTTDIEMTGRSVTLDMSQVLSMSTSQTAVVTEALAIDWNSGSESVRCVIRNTNGSPQLIARMVEGGVDVGSPVITLPTGTKSLRVGVLADGRSVWHSYSLDGSTFSAVADVHLFPTFVCTGVAAKWTWQCQLQSGTPTSLTSAISSRIYGSTKVAPTPTGGSPVKSDAWRSLSGTANSYVSFSSDSAIVSESALTNSTDGIWFAAVFQRAVPASGQAAPLDVLMGIQRDATTAHRFLMVQASSDTQTNVVQFYDQDSGGWGDPSVKVPADGASYFVLGHRSKAGVITTHAINLDTGVKAHSAANPTVAVGATAATLPRIILGAASETTGVRVSRGKYAVWGIGTGRAPTNAEVEAATYQLDDGTYVVTRDGLEAIPGFKHGVEANFPKATMTDLAATGTLAQFAESGSTAVQAAAAVPYSTQSTVINPPPSTFVPQPTLTVSAVGRSADGTQATAHLHTPAPTAVVGPPSFTPNANPIGFYAASQATGTFTQIGSYGTATDIDYTWPLDAPRYFGVQYRDSSGTSSAMTVVPANGAPAFVVASTATAPRAPSGLQAAQSNTNVVLTWTPDNSGAVATGFNVYQNGTKLTASPLAATATSYTVTNGASAPNSWTVTAVNSTTESPQSTSATLLVAGGVSYRRPTADAVVAGFTASDQGVLYATQDDPIGWAVDPPTIDPTTFGDNQVMAAAGGNSIAALAMSALALPSGLMAGSATLWAHCYVRPNIVGTVSYRLGTNGAETLLLTVNDSVLQWRSAVVPATVAGDPTLQLVFRTNNLVSPTGTDSFWIDAAMVRVSLQNTPVAPPRTPTGLALTNVQPSQSNPSLVSATATWVVNTETNLGVPAYLLYTGPSAAGPWTLRATAVSNATSAILTGLAIGSYVGIAAQDNRTPPNVSSVSTGVAIPTLAPGTPTLTASRATATSTTINLTATASAGSTVTGWKFFRDGVALTAAFQTSNTYVDQVDANAHVYTVVASNTIGSSPTSAQVTVAAVNTNPLPDITAPTGVTPVSGNNYGEEYIYIDVPPANQLIEGFDLYLKLTTTPSFPSSPEYSGPGVVVSQGGSRRILFDLTGLLPGSTYNYEIQAWRNE